MRKRSKIQKARERIQYANTYRKGFEQGYEIGFNNGRKYERKGSIEAKAFLPKTDGTR